MLRYIVGVFALCFLTVSNLGAYQPKPYIVMHSRDAGMFSVWMDVLSMVDCYEKGLYSGIQVSFGKEGLYYDENHGENWWEYYCEPIKLGYGLDIHVMGDPPNSPGWIEEKLTRHEVRDYIEKYIHVKSFIMDRVAQFQIENFVGNFVISIHYRGTDKFIHEAREVPYENVAKQVDKVIKESGGQKYRIFIATDEQNFLDYMIQKYGDIVCFNDAMRSSNGEPLHVNNSDPYQQGLETVMDAILLSRGHYLIRTTSNLSRWSTFFNPDLPVFELNQLDFH